MDRPAPGVLGEGMTEPDWQLYGKRLEEILHEVHAIRADMETHRSTLVLLIDRVDLMQREFTATLQLEVSRAMLTFQGGVERRMDRLERRLDQMQH
jgi:hypothetical protein